MKEFDIRDYIWNIYEISSYYKLNSIYTALDMFIENLDLGYKRYAGTELDFESLSKVWKQLPKSYHTHEKAVFRHVIDIAFGKICDAWKAKDRDKFDKACRVRMIYGIVKDSK